MRRIGVEWLCFSTRGGSSSWVTHMANSHVSCQGLHVSLLEYISDQAIGFSLEQLFSFTGHDSSSILPSMLQYCKAVIDDWRCRSPCLGDDANDSTHSGTRTVVELTALEVDGESKGTFLSSFLLVHGAISLVPAVTSHLGSDTITTGCALALLLVVTVATAAAATDMRGLLALAHAWSTLTHLNTSAGRRPTLCISGLPPVLRASLFTDWPQYRRRHQSIPFPKADR